MVRIVRLVALDTSLWMDEWKVTSQWHRGNGPVPLCLRPPADLCGRMCDSLFNDTKALQLDLSTS